MARIPRTLRSKITYKELIEPRYAVTADGGVAVRICQIWGDTLDTFCKDMLGYSWYNDGKLLRFVPENHPIFPDLYATEVEFLNPLGAAEQRNDPGRGLFFESSKVSVTYKKLDYPVAPDADRPAGRLDDAWRYVTRRETFSVNAAIGADKKAAAPMFEFDSDSTVVAEPPTILEAGGDVLLKWNQVPSQVNDDTGEEFLPTALRTRIAGVMGKINSAEFFGYPPHTLLCLPPDDEPITMPNNRRGWNVNYKFAKRGTVDLTVPGPDGVDATDTPDWDRVLRRDGKYHKIRIRGGARRPYQTADFYDLFRVD